MKRRTRRKPPSSPTKAKQKQTGKNHVRSILKKKVQQETKKIKALRKTERVALLDNPQAFLAAIIDSSDDAIVGKTLDGVIRSWNKGAERIFGYTAKEAIGQHITLIIPKDRQQEEQEIIARLRRGKRIDHFETVRRAKDGTLLDLSLTISPIRDSKGKIIGASKVARDIRERKGLEQEKRTLHKTLEQKVEERTEELTVARREDRANLNRFKKMIAYLPLAAMALDEHDKVVQVNDLLCRFFNFHFTADEMIGKDGWYFNGLAEKNAEDRKEYRAQTNAMREATEPLLGQEIYMKNGRILQRDFIPIFEHGESHGKLILYRDITQERKVDAAKSEFMSLASHQLRTPLTSLRWTMGRLQKKLSEGATEENQQMVKDGKEAAARMSYTIDTMLKIAGIESGKTKPAKARISVNDFLAEAVSLLQEQIKGKHLQCDIQCMADLWVETDPSLLREIIQNLLGNAVKYTPDGGAITVLGKNHSAHVRLIVEDTGYGIPVHQQGKIFRKFFRGENVMNLEASGSGLGLYLVALITKLLDGDISFTSEEGKGTTFTLLLPATHT